MKYRWCDNVQCAVVVAEGNVYPHHKLNIKFVNRHFTALFGYEAGEVIGSDVACLAYRAVDRDMHPAYVRTFCETGVDRVPAGTGRLVEGRHRDGSCILLTVTLNKNPDNEYVAFFSPAPAQVDLSPSVCSTESTGSTVTSAESKRAFFDTFMTAVVHAAHKDGELCISYTNKSVTRLFGYSREECVGMKVADLIFDPEHASGHREYVRAYEETGVSHGIVDNDVGRAITGRHKDGYVDGLTPATSAPRLGALLPHPHRRQLLVCAQARTQTHKHKHTQTLTHSHTHTHTPAHTRARKRSHTRTHAQTHTRTHTHVHPHARTHTHTQTHTHMCTHTRARAVESSDAAGTPCTCACAFAS